MMKHCESTLNLAVSRWSSRTPIGSSRVTVQLSTKQQSITFNVLPAFNLWVSSSWVCRVVGRAGGVGSGRACQENKATKGVVIAWGWNKYH